MVGTFAMETTTLIPLILYPWMALSIGVYGWRWWNRRKHPAPPVAEEEAVEPRSTTRLLADAVKNPEPKLAAPPPSAPAGSLVEQVIKQELEARKRAEDGGPAIAVGASSGRSSSGRSGLFAGGDAPLAEQPAADRPHPTVAEAVAGITWPCDLAPLITGELDPHRVAFITRGVPAGTVAVSLADELERLGYRLRTESATVAVGERDGTELRVVVHPEPAKVERDGAPAFPTANAASVVVELTT